MYDIKDFINSLSFFDKKRILQTKKEFLFIEFINTSYSLLFTDDNRGVYIEKYSKNSGSGQYSMLIIEEIREFII